MVTHSIDDLPVAEIMTRWPGTIRVFLALNMHCVGCPISIFHTLGEAAAEHRIDTKLLFGAILEATGRL